MTEQASLNLQKVNVSAFIPERRSLLQRKCACGQHTIAGSECAECRKKRKGMMQRSATSSAPVNTAPPVVHDVLSSPGQPLDTATRTFMEPRFGHDFSGVRVHTDAKAAESVRAVNALAYTVGKNVVFGAGQYAPGTMEGKRLLAHELTHVGQQKDGSTFQRRLTIGSPTDHFEREAEAFATQIVSGESVQVKPSPVGAQGQTIQRDLATPLPDEPAPGQPDLTDEQIQAAIAFNRTRYDENNTRLIQDLLGGPVTGVWTEENILAVAATQEQYGLRKDGMVGFETFRFLNNEARLERLSKSTSNCLTTFMIIGPDTPQVTLVTSPTCQFEIKGHFKTAAHFSERCGCSQYQYRQFIKGHLLLNRGGVVHDIGAASAGFFNKLPSGEGLTTTFEEDGNTDWATSGNGVNYGHRDDPAVATTDAVNAENHYINDRLEDDKANGCRYRGEDYPGVTVEGCQSGDVYDLEINFRGEIQRNGTPVETKTWTAIKKTLSVP
jgi:hypothetical protein